MYKNSHKALKICAHVGPITVGYEFEVYNTTVLLVCTKQSQSIYACVGRITVGYEFEVYTTTEGMGFVEICAVITQPPDGIAPRDFTVSSTTRDGTASKRFYSHVEQQCICILALPQWKVWTMWLHLLT